MGISYDCDDFMMLEIVKRSIDDGRGLRVESWSEMETIQDPKIGGSTSG